MYLITKWFGTFLFDNEKLIDKIIFPKNKKEISRIINTIQENEILSEEKKISKDKDILVSEKRLSIIGDYKPDDPFFKKIEINPEDYTFSIDLINFVSCKLIKKNVEEKLKSPDLQIIQMVNAVDDLIQTSNLLSERITNWEELIATEDKISPLKNIFSKVNLEIKNLENKIDEEMYKIAPNTAKVIGPLIGARLISLASGLNNLAYMPASTIQVLGAEKALFRFKKEGGKPPKHGVIFQHPIINKSPRKNRGKIARYLSNKISLAVKADVFSKRDIAEELIKDIKERINEIQNL